MVYYFVWMFVNIIMIASSRKIAIWLNKNNKSVSDIFITGVVVYFSQITISLIALALFQKLTFPWAMFSNVMIALVMYSLLRRHTFDSWGRIQSEIKNIYHERDITLWLLLSLFVFQIIIGLIKIIILPPLVYDVLTYHLGLIIEWFQQGRIIHAIPTAVERINSMSLGGSVLSLWYFLCGKNDLLIEIPQFMWGILVVPIAFSFLRKFGLGKKNSLKFAITIYFIPSILMLSLTAKDHVSLNVGFVGMLLFLLAFINTRDYRMLTIAGILTGLVAGYKLVAVVYFAIAGLVFLWLLFIYQRDIFRKKHELEKFICSVLGAGTIAAAIGGYWYFRNFLLYHRLQGSFQSRKFGLGDSVWDAILYRSQSLWSNIKDFLPRILDYQYSYMPDLFLTSGFGPQFFAWGLIGLGLFVVAIVRKSTWSDKSLLIGLVGILLMGFYFMLYYSLWNYRAFLVFAILMLIYAFIMFERCGALRNPTMIVFQNVLMLVASLWSIVVLLPPSNVHSNILRSLTEHSVEYRSAATVSQIFKDNVYWTIRHSIPAEEAIAYLGHSDMPSYQFYDNRWQRKIYYLDEKKYFVNKKGYYAPVEELNRFLEEKNIRYIYAGVKRHEKIIIGNHFTKIQAGLYFYGK